MQAKEDYNQFIKEVIFRYHQVSETSLSLLYSIARIKHLKKNEILLPIGKTAKDIHILVQGAIIAYFIDEEGNTYNKNVFLEGNFVASTVSYLTNSPSDFALEAIEDCIIISFNYRNYRQYINNNEDLKNFYIAYLEKNWVIDKEKREIDIVMKNASSRYLELLEKHPEIDQRVPLSHLASHLGITPTQMSRIRKKVKK